MREMTFTEAAREGLAEEMERDESVFVLGEGIGERGGNFGTTAGLYARFGPERLRDTPICERGFTGLAIGAALAGARPVVDLMFMDFGLDAVGELVQQAAKLRWMSSGRVKIPLVVRGCIGVLGAAAAHHSGAYYSLFMHLPGFHVAVPSTPADAKGLLKAAIRSEDPVIFLEHRGVLGVKGPVPEGEHVAELGKARVVRSGTGVTVVAIAVMVHRCLEAAEILQKEGLSVELIDPRTLAPLDVDTIRESVAKTGRLLVVDEDYGPCGAGAEIAAQIMERSFDDLDAPVRRLNGAFAPAPYSPPLEKAAVLSVAAVAQAVRDLAAE